MKPIGGMVFSCCSFVSCFFYSIRLGLSQMDHSIEDGTAEATFDLLILRAFSLPPMSCL